MPFWKENVKNLKACEDSIDDGRDGAYQYSTGCLNVYEVTPPKKPPPSSTLGRKSRISSSPNDYCQCTLHAGKHQARLKTQQKYPTAFYQILLKKSSLLTQ
jgi:hypothetical protein